MSAARSWRLVGVIDGDPPFVYSVGLWSQHGKPELWVSCRGECGHTTGCEGAAIVLNDLAAKLLDAPECDDFVHGSYSYDFGTGILVFTPEQPRAGLTDALETYHADATAPVIRLRWRCCCGSRTPEGTQSRCGS